MMTEPNKLFKAAIFDLDGTLAFTLPDLQTSMNYMLTRYGYPTKTREQLKTYLSCGVWDFVKGSLPEDKRGDDDHIRACLDCYTERYEAHFLDETVLYPGLAELLPRMKEAGIRLAVNTNKNQYHAQAIIDKLAPGIFEDIKGDGPYPSKPDPTGALEIAAAYWLEPAEICYIGDSNFDMETAINAGMFPIGVDWGYCPELLEKAGAGAIVSNADQLAKWFGL